MNNTSARKRTPDECTPFENMMQYAESFGWKTMNKEQIAEEREKRRKEAKRKTKRKPGPNAPVIHIPSEEEREREKRERQWKAEESLLDVDTDCLCALQSMYLQAFKPQREYAYRASVSFEKADDDVEATQWCTKEEQLERRKKYRQDLLANEAKNSQHNKDMSFIGWVSEETRRGFATDEDLRRIILGLRGLCVTRHDVPCALWLYAHDDEHIRNWCFSTYDMKQMRHTNMNYIVCVSPAFLETSAIASHAFDILQEHYPVLYDERAGDGYKYETKSVGLCKYGARLTNDGSDIPYMDELCLLQHAASVSFITDGVDAHWDSYIPDDELPEEVRENEQNTYTRFTLGTSRHSHDREGPSSITNRMFRDFLFEYGVTEPLMTDVEKETFAAAIERWKINPGFVRYLTMHADGDQFASREMLDAMDIMKASVILWENRPYKHPSGRRVYTELYELMDSDPTDEQVIGLFREQMRDLDGEMLMEQVRAGESIWDVLTKPENRTYIVEDGAEA